jgi:hypothetical protein
MLYNRTVISRGWIGAAAISLFLWFLILKACKVL